MKRAIVTGAAGFVGSHLVDQLLAEGWRVIGIDNLFTGSLSNLAGAFGSLRFDFVRRDVRQPFDEIAADVVFNLACPASPPKYQIDPHFTLTTSIFGAWNAVAHARRHGSVIVQASTSEVYGDPEVHPQREDYRGSVNTLGPRACYDEGKRVAETILADAHRAHGVRIQIARIFNTYGPRMAIDDGRVVSGLLAAALSGEALPVFGDGTQTRSFCYVDDLVNGLMALAELESWTGPINLGNPGEFTINELAGLVGQVLGRPVALDYRPLPQDDPRRRRPDIARAQELLGFSPDVPLAEGLARTAADFDMRLRLAAGF